MAPNDPFTTNYNQRPRRKAEFITPPNILKAKVGSGGLGEDILEKAQKLLENNATDFLPLAEMYLSNLLKGIEFARNPAPDDRHSGEELIAGMLYPAMQLKANGGMFRFPLVTTIGNKLVQFLEAIENPNQDAVEIVLAFHTTLKVIVSGRITGNGGKHGRDLLEALDSACLRYFSRHATF